MRQPIRDALRAAAPLPATRRYKAMFDNTWILAIALAAMQVVLCWYLRLSQIVIGPVVWTLAALVGLQSLLAAHGARLQSAGAPQRLAFASQLLGSALLAVSWHLYGGLQQPLFPLLMVLPLLPGALLFNFWQQQASLLAVLLVLSTGVLLSPDTYAFIEEHYGAGALDAQLLPAWFPHSRMAFTEVATTRAYDLTLTGGVGFIAIAVSTTARALVSLFQQDGERLARMEAELRQQQRFSNHLVTQAPACEVLLMPATGRIVLASERFRRQFSLEDPAGCFLLDAVTFRYPDVVRRLLQSGGEALQPAVIDGREQVLRLRAESIAAAESPLTVLSLEPHAEICWRGELDAVEEPLFAIDDAGFVVCPNRSARELLGAAAEGGVAHALFEATLPRWWDIAPLDSARRLLERQGRQYLALIRRDRLADSVGDLCFVRLQERAATPLAAAD